MSVTNNKLNSKLFYLYDLIIKSPKGEDINMRIMPISLLRGFKNSDFIKNSTQTNVFLKNNECDSVSFTGSKENIGGKIPMSYELETRIPKYPEADGMPLGTKNAISEIDEKANNLIQKSNLLHKRAEEHKKTIIDVFNNGKKSSTPPLIPDEGTVFTNGNQADVLVKKDENVYLRGRVDREQKRVKSIELYDNTDSKNSVTESYNFNNKGQLTNYKKENSDGEKTEITYEPNGIVAVDTHDKTDRRISLELIFDLNDNIINAYYTDENMAENKEIQKTRMPYGGNNRTLIFYAADDEPVVSDWIEYD